MRSPAAVLACAVSAIMLAGCLGASDRPVEVTVNGGTPAGEFGGTTEPGATPTLVAFTPSPGSSRLDVEDLHGFTMPIEGACLPSGDQLMPNAPREYRDGVHEGVDFYFGDACVTIERGTPVLAAHDGVVIRADHHFVDLTLEEVEELEALTEEQGFSDPETLDRFRGRQVWIDHGNGVVTRYCHLDEVADDLAEGMNVTAGTVIGGVGDSGTPESVTAPGTELHLHWEVRVEGGFLGEELPPEAVRSLYARLFDPADE